MDYGTIVDEATRCYSIAREIELNTVSASTFTIHCSQHHTRIFAPSHFIIAQRCNAVFQHHRTIVAQHSRPFLHHFSLFVAIHCRSSQPRSKPSQHHRRRNAHRRQRSFISQPISIRVCRKSQRPVNIHWALAVLKIKSQNVAQCRLTQQA